MILERTERFRRAYRKLAARDRDRVDAALRRLVADLRHPSLRVKRLEGTPGIWSARASDDLRLTFEVSEGRMLLRNVGRHDPTLRSP